MIATLISLTERHERAAKQFGENLDFQSLFEKARLLRAGSGRKDSHDAIATYEWREVKNLFQKEIADVVFQKKLFNRSILTSIWYVADLLTAYAKGEIATVGMVEHLSDYSDQESPQKLLLAANSAFLFFVFWPEGRARRSIQYRKYSILYGPSLYAHYGNVTRKPIGSHMSEAFEPLGMIARERFALI
jgi:hypothetical protein